MMTLIMPMTYLEVGQRAEVVEIGLKGEKRTRMLDLGINVGTKIQCVCKKRDGGPSAYDIRGSVFAFREEDSKYIIIKRDRTEEHEEICP